MPKRKALVGCDGDLFFGTWVLGSVRRAVFHSGSRTVLDSVVIFHAFDPLYERVTDVTVGPDGLLWISTAGYSATIWRVLPAPAGESSRLRHLKAPPNPFVRPVHPGVGPPKD